MNPPVFEIIAIAASAGGLNAISQVLSNLPADFPTAIVIVQHLDPRHRSLMADILSRRTPLIVKQAEESDRISWGTVYIAPPNRHLLVNPDGTISLSQSELVHFVRPSADLLFESVAASYREKAIAVVLTGASESIRIWSAGCASGEEAYTLAIILAELLGTEQFRQRVKIYATDIDLEALEEARHAIYPAKSLESVPQDLRLPCFEPIGEQYIFRSDLRRAVIFGRHDLVQDAPIHLQHRIFRRVTKINERDRILKLSQAIGKESGNSSNEHFRLRELAFDTKS